MYSENARKQPVIYAHSIIQYPAKSTSKGDFLVGVIAASYDIDDTVLCGDIDL